MHPHDSSLYGAESSSLLPAPLKMADVAEVTALCSSKAPCSVNNLILNVIIFQMSKLMPCLSF